MNDVFGGCSPDVTQDVWPDVSRDGAAVAQAWLVTSRVGSWTGIVQPGTIHWSMAIYPAEPSYFHLNIKHEHLARHAHFTTGLWWVICQLSMPQIIPAYIGQKSLLPWWFIQSGVNNRALIPAHQHCCRLPRVNLRGDPIRGPTSWWEDNDGCRCHGTVWAVGHLAICIHHISLTMII